MFLKKKRVKNGKGKRKKRQRVVPPPPPPKKQRLERKMNIPGHLQL